MESVKNFFGGMKPETRRLLIKSVVITIAIIVIGIVAIVIAIAKNGGLEGLFRMIEAVALTSQVSYPDIAIDLTRIPEHAIGYVDYGVKAGL